MTIDRNSPIPLYHQLKTLILEQIETGTWQPGERIPTELELCQGYGISRAPVRQALAELVRDDVIIRRPGKGTFVSECGTQWSSGERLLRVTSSDPSWQDVLGLVSGIWNASQASQPITVQSTTVDHNAFYSSLSTAIGAGTAPDVAMVDCVWVAGLARAGFLFPLDEIDPYFDQRGLASRLYPAFAQANSYEGHLYGMPAKADASLLWYRQDWFEQEGLAPPKDWDDLVSVSKYFGRGDVARRYMISHPLALPGGRSAGEATVYNLMPFIWSAGGQLLHDGQVVLNSSETRQALEFLRGLGSLGIIEPAEIAQYRWDTGPYMLAKGQVAMALGGSYQAELILRMSRWRREEFPARVGCVPLPAAPGMAPVSTIGGTSYVVLRQCECADVVLDFLRLATEPRVIESIYRSILLNLPYPSFLELLDPERDRLLVDVAQLIASGRARPSIPGYFRVSRQLQSMFESVISGEGPIEDIVQRTADFVRVLLE
jgi:multiple sugar transport system substrate-binding protein